MEGRRANLRLAARPINWKEERRRALAYASSRQQQHKPGPERAALLAYRRIDRSCVLLTIAFRCTTRNGDSQPLRDKNQENRTDFTFAFGRKRTALQTESTDAIATTIQPA